MTMLAAVTMFMIKNFIFILLLCFLIIFVLFWNDIKTKLFQKRTKCKINN